MSVAASGPLGDEDTELAVTQVLIERGKLRADAVERARRVRADAGGERLHTVLTKLGLVAETDVAEALAQVLGIPLAPADSYPDEPVAEDGLSPKFLKHARIVPTAVGPDGIHIAMADPLDEFAVKAVQLATGHAVHRQVGVPADIDRALERGYGPAGGGGRSIDDGAADAFDEASEDAERLRDMASEAPVIKLVNTLIGRAVEARASDIHIEPFESTLRIRYRIDGVLRDVDSPPIQLKSAIVSRVKIMAKLNIAERRLPQDGRVKLAVRGKDVDFRVSTLPTMFGESVVMRILDKGAAKFEFEVLGFEGAPLKAYLQALEQPNGILLVTGPTGSGKTTTLYASLLRLNTDDRKLITVEDPIEYQLHGVNQIQVKPQIGLDFGHALRSILRQDPDVIMIGEIRDRETAQIAAQAALTGHLVLSTLHTNSAAGSVTRLLDIGLEDYLLASTVNGITAQRLVRVLCHRCRELHPALEEIVEDLSLESVPHDGPIRIFRAVGCEQCGGSGYVGRTVISEVMILSDELRRLTMRKANAQEIHDCAVDAGMRTLVDDGIGKALRGLTSIEELLRVTRDI